MKYNLVTLVVIILKDTAAVQVLFIFSIPGYFVHGTSLLLRSTVAFTYLKVKFAKCLCLRPVVLVYGIWSCYIGLGLGHVSSGLGLVILVLVWRIWSCLHHCQTPYLVRLHAPSPRTHSALCLRPRFSARRASFGSLFQQSSLPPPMHRDLDKNTGSAHFRSQRIHQNAGFCIKNVQKIPGVATPGPLQRKGRHLFAPTPCPPAECWCPSASSRLATALRKSEYVLYNSPITKIISVCFYAS